MANAYNSILFTQGTVSFTDFDISFLSNPTTNDLRTKSDVDAIKQSMKILLFTDMLERPFQPNLSGNLGQLLFEPYNNLTGILIKQQITNVLLNEPRIAVRDVTVITDTTTEGAISISISFIYVNAQTLENLQVMLTRTR